MTVKFGQMVVFGCLAVLSGASGAAGQTPCVPEQADPTTTNVVGGRFYFEERDVPAPFNTTPPTALAGAVLGAGTWVYEEMNEVAGLQRGDGYCLPGPFPECTQDPIQDDHCGVGPDRLRLVIH